MSWISITSYISYKELAECLDIQTDTEYVSDGVITPEGTNYVFEEVADYCFAYKREKKTEISEELQLAKENALIQELLSSYLTPEEVAKKIDWTAKFNLINQYTNLGSRLAFLDQLPKGDALIWYELPDGFTLTLFPPVMIFINDMQYLEDSTLPEFNFDDISSYDVVIALEQAIQHNICDVEKEIEEFVS